MKLSISFKIHLDIKKLNYFKQIYTVNYTLVANMTFSSVKPSISTSNVALKANLGTVLKVLRIPKHPQHVQID